MNNREKYDLLEKINWTLLLTGPLVAAIGSGLGCAPIVALGIGCLFFAAITTVILVWDD